MEPKKTIFMLFFLALITISVASAQDFMAYSTVSGVNVCACSLFEDKIIIHNPGPIPMGYTLSIEGDISKFSSLGRSYVVIGPEDSIEIPFVVNIPCNLDEKISYSIVIQQNELILGDMPSDASLGQRKAIYNTLDVESCNNNLISFIGPNSFVNKPCRETTYKMRITNTGTNPEIYDLSVKGIKQEYVSFSMNPVMVPPGSSEDVLAVISLPCESFGDFEGRLVSSAKNSGFVSEIGFLLNIQRDYGFSVKSGFYSSFEIQGDDGPKIDYVADFSGNLSRYSVCANERSAVPIELSNDAMVSNTYDIDVVSSKRWIFTDNDSLSVHGGEKGYFNIVFDPTKKDIGQYDINLEIESVRGDLYVEKAISIDVIDCSSFDVYGIVYNDISCCGTEKSYVFNVQNKASIDNIYTVDVQGEGYVDLPEFRVKAGETRNITYFTYQDCSSSPIDRSTTLVFKDKRTAATLSRQIDLSFVSDKDCHALSFRESSDKVFHEYTEEKIVMRNEGIEGSQYYITIQGPAWVYIDNSSPYLNAGESVRTLLKFDPPSAMMSGKYYVTLKALSDNGYVHVHNFEIELREKFCGDCISQIFESSKANVIAWILVITLLIVLSSYAFAKKNPAIGLILALIAVFLVLGAAFLVLSSCDQCQPGYFVSDTYIDENETDIMNETGMINKTYEENETIPKVDLEDNETEQVGNESGQPQEEEKTSFWKRAGEFISSIFRSDRSKPSENITSNVSINKTPDIITNQTTISNESSQIPSDNMTNQTEEIAISYEEELYNYLLANNLTGSFRYQIWCKNRVHILDLSEAFDDPDMDDLVFTSTQPEFINVQIKDNLVSMTPIEDWHGVDYITFKATDSFGAQALSPEIALIVREGGCRYENPISKAFETIKQGRGNYVIYLLFTIIILILLVVIFSGNKKEEVNNSQKQKSRK